MTRPVAGAGSTLLCALLAAAGAVVMSAAAGSLQSTATTGHASQALISWVLVAIALLGALLCLYLALVWSLASAILLSGPATRTGAALLLALRILAPRMARRVTAGAATATAVTALTLAPSIASEGPSAPPSLPEHAPTQTSQMLPSGGSAPDPAPEAAAPGADSGPSRSGGSAPLPTLGWGEAPSHSSSDNSSPPSTPTSARDDGPSAAAETIVVRSGDSLWSISDDLLGPTASDPADIASTWPVLHEANQEVIGADPDQLLPGMELTVPASLTTKDLP